jgi:hypothetical protein
MRGLIGRETRWVQFTAKLRTQMGEIAGLVGA